MYLSLPFACSPPPLPFFSFQSNLRESLLLSLSHSLFFFSFSPLSFVFSIALLEVYTTDNLDSPFPRGKAERTSLLTAFDLSKVEAPSFILHISNTLPRGPRPVAPRTVCPRKSLGPSAPGVLRPRKSLGPSAPGILRHRNWLGR